MERMFIFVIYNMFMKRFFVLFFTLLICSCCERAFESSLRSAETLIQSSPDSALVLLLKIDPNNLESPKTKAKYALLMSAALDKNYIDVCSDSLILKAVTYYSRYGSPKDKMLSWYYQGICLKNAGELIPAILAFEKAEKEASHLEEWLYSGLIYRNKAALFNLSNNSVVAIENWEKAISCFDKVNADLYTAHAELSLAIDYSNIAEFAMADSLINNLELLHPENRSIQNRCRLKKAGILVKKEIEPDKAIALFHSVPIKRFDVLDYGYLAQALEMIDRRDSADYWLNEGYRHCSDDKEVATIDYIKAFVEKKRGNYPEAFRLLEHSSSVQDSVTRVLLQQSVSSSLRDYYKDEALKNEERIRSMREKSIWGAVFCVFIVLALVMAVFTLSRKKDRLIKEQMARLALEEKELERLHREKAYLVGSLFSEKVDRLDQLCESYFKSEDTKQQGSLFKQVKQLAAKIKNDEELFASLEKDLDRYCNGIMAKLRAQVPRIKGENLLIIMLFFAGFSYETVLIILNKNSIQSLKTARSRYRKEILDAQAPDSDFFLKMLVVKKRSRDGSNENIEVR